MADIMTVVEEGTMALTQQLSHFNELGSAPQQPPQAIYNPFVPQRSHTDHTQVCTFNFIVTEL